MEYQQILVEVEDGVGRIIFNRPKLLNAYSEQMSRELKQAVASLSENPDVRVVVVTGNGRAFMAGADINMLKGWSEEPRGKQGVADILSGFFSPSLFEQSPKPFIAAVNGFAFGMGCEVALGCDMRIAAASAQFGQPEIKLGVITGAGGSQRLPRLVGSGKAMEMILTGDPIDAQDALQWGLVNRVVPDDELEQTVAKITGKLCRLSATALQRSKEVVLASHNRGLYDGVAHELDLFAGIFESPDAREGISSFLEKRRPSFNKA